MNDTTDMGYTPSRWEFDEEVSRVFDDMLRRSIPQYDVMRTAVFDVGCRFVKPRTSVVDLGCSRGEAMAPFVSRFGASVRFVGVERSKPMIEAARERFKGYIDSGIIDIRDLDLRTDYPVGLASLTLAVLVLQFTPIEHRPRIVQRIYEATAADGALILVEKIIGHTGLADSVLVENYEKSKQLNGYSDDDIQRKKLSLEGVLVPVTAKWNEEMLKDAGFRIVECFWRWMNFSAWLAVK